MEIQFISVLAQAQRLSQATAIRNIVTDAIGIAQAYPAVLDKLDFDQIVDELSSIDGVPPKVIRPDEDVAAIREQRAAEQAKMVQQQQMMEMMSRGAQDLKAVGDAKTGPDTALGDMLRAAGLKEEQRQEQAS